MSNYAIKVDDLGKAYMLRSNASGTLRGSLSSFWKQGWNSFHPKEIFWALEKVVFQAPHGQILGVIGRNGAGKSTLLKILSRITPPTKGRVELNGSVASLLEVGTGFHPELTGRENIFLNGSILGMTKVEIRQQFDQIVDFSGVERFIGTPVKHYSSGMYVRLAFAVAAHLRAEILLIDEVLAVGDLEFQQKCLGKMEEVSKSGRTVLLVSHNLGVIEKTCEKVLLLDKGHLINFGLPTPLINQYAQLGSATGITSQFDGPLKEKVSLKGIRINQKDPATEQVIVSQLDALLFEVKLQIGKLAPFRVTLSLYKNGCRVFSLHDEKAMASPEGPILSCYKIPPCILRPGLYQISIGGHEKNEWGDWFWKNEIASFIIKEDWNYLIEPINLGLINIIDAKCQRVHL